VTAIIKCNLKLNAKLKLHEVCRTVHKLMQSHE